MGKRKAEPGTAVIGRPTKYEAQTIERLIQAIGAGLTIEDACVYGDIHKSTFYDWIQTYPDFSDAVKTAEVKAKMRRILRIELAAQNGAWQADAWYLERKYPEEFGRKLTLQVAPEDAALLKRLGMTLEQAWKMLIQELAQDAYTEIVTNATDTDASTDPEA